MTMRMVNAYHIEHGEKAMFPIDLQHAVANHPLEWAKAPWDDKMKAETLPKLREQRKAAREAGQQDLSALETVPGSNHAGAAPVDMQRIKDGKQAVASDEPSSAVASKAASDNDKAVDQAKGAKSDKS